MKLTINMRLLLIAFPWKLKVNTFILDIICKTCSLKNVHQQHIMNEQRGIIYFVFYRRDNILKLIKGKRQGDCILYPNEQKSNTLAKLLRTICAIYRYLVARYWNMYKTTKGISWILFNGLYSEPKYSLSLYYLEELMLFVTVIQFQNYLRRHNNLLFYLSNKVLSRPFGISAILFR